MENIEQIRHSFAHLLAAAVKELYPNAKPTLGPAIEHGFYYDFDFQGETINDQALLKIEKKMKQILSTWQSKDALWFEGKKVSKDEAKEQFSGNQFKDELIEEIDSRGEDITLYQTGSFTDLCRGGHAENPSDLNKEAFKLTSVAGAYWRGDENNPMLTRIYGVAFSSKEELDAHLTMVEEAKARDHKKLGKELDLFTFSSLVGQGLPLWTPKGTLMRHLLDNFIWSMRESAGYQRVEIPHIAKKELYETSGHWQKFSDELFKIVSREGHEFALKPMNCPHHTQIFARHAFSYKDMPQRYANTTMVYRDEQSGELGGLSRVRAISQDDAHVFCRTAQVKEEFIKVWGFIDTLYSTLGFNNLRVRLSFHDPEQPEKYLGDKELWKRAEAQIAEIAKEKGVETIEGIGEAAFYGPKVDFMAKDSIGREIQVATIQLDMNLPERFDLYCTNESGEKERIVMIHAAIAGSLERLMAVLIEHFAGKFPTWLAPVQARILAVSDKFQDYGQKVKDMLKDAGIRVELADANESLGKRIRQAKNDRIPYILVVGEQEEKDGSVSAEHFKEGKLDAMKISAFSEKIKQEVESKKI